jgi:predicted nucleic acid-binding protein
MEKQTITALLDANVLYPAPVRDLLLHLADTGLYCPKWTDKIHDEWMQNLLLNRRDLKLSSLKAAKKAMNLAFPDADTKGFLHQIEKLQLPDNDDRHVLAAAIHAKADLIITFNVKDFPEKYLASFTIKSIHPDDFIVKLIHQDKEAAWKAFNNQVANLKHPPMTKEEVLNSLKKCGLRESVNLLLTLAR